MDNTLKRPLFKRKAMEAYKAKHGGKIPGLMAGGIMPAYNMLRAVAAPTFRFLLFHQPLNQEFYLRV